VVVNPSPSPEPQLVMIEPMINNIATVTSLNAADRNVVA
jgi:hypothetical protein